MEKTALVVISSSSCAVYLGIRSQLLPVRHPEEVASVHEHQEHHPESLRRPLQRHLPGHLREVRGLRFGVQSACCSSIFELTTKQRKSSRIISLIYICMEKLRTKGINSWPCAASSGQCCRVCIDSQYMDQLFGTFLKSGVADG